MKIALNDRNEKNLESMADALKTKSDYEKPRGTVFWMTRLDRLKSIQAPSIDIFNYKNKGYLKTIACSRLTFVKENTILCGIITENRLLLQVKCA